MEYAFDFILRNIRLRIFMPSSPSIVPESAFDLCGF